jgi:hypothetical protein
VKDLKRDCAAKALLVQISFWPATNIDDEDMRITTKFEDDDAKSKKRKRATFLVNLSSNNHIMCFFLSYSAAFLSSLDPFFLSLSHICMSMCQSNPSLSVS